MDVKKVILFSSISVFSVACGKNAQAQEVNYDSQNNLNAYIGESSTNANGQCGDPSKGQFTCNTDSIGIQYSVDNIVNNNWTNNGNFFGPFLSLDPSVGSFKSQQVILTGMLCE